MSSRIARAIHRKIKINPSQKKKQSMGFWIGFIYSFGADSEFDSRYFSLAWTESLGKPYLHVGRLGAALQDR